MLDRESRYENTWKYYAADVFVVFKLHIMKKVGIGDGSR